MRVHTRKCTYKILTLILGATTGTCTSSVIEYGKVLVTKLEKVDNQYRQHQQCQQYQHAQLRQGPEVRRLRSGMWQCVLAPDGVT